MFEEIADRPVPSVAVAAPAQELAPRATVRGAQLAVALLFLVNGGCVGSWVPHIPQRAAVLGLNAATLGLVLLSGGIGALCAMPLASPLVRWAGTKRLSIAAGIAFPALLTAALLVGHIPLLVAVLFLAGLSAATMDVSMNAHGVMVEGMLGQRTVSMFHAVFSVGCFAGAGIHSFLMSRHVPAEVLALGSGFVLCATVAAIAPRLLPRAVEVRFQALQTAAPGKPRRRGLPHPALLLMGTLCFATMVSEGAMGDWSALLLRVVHHLPNGTAGYGYTCFAALMVLGRFTGDLVTTRLGEPRTLRLGGLVSAAGLALVLFAHPLALVLLGFALTGAGLANASPVLYRTAATMPGFAPGEGLSTAVGVGYAGLLMGPPLLGLLGRAAGLPSIFMVLLGLSIVLAGAAPLVARVRNAMHSRVQNHAPAA